MIGKLVKFILKVVLYGLLLSFLLVFLGKFLPIPRTLYMIRCKVEQPSMSISHDWVSIDKMSPHLVVAVIASEDNLFMKHNGFSWQTIQKLVDDRANGKKIRRGGSTISQQTAKNVFTLAHRTYFRKGVEAYFTFLIEKMWGKERIMEVYLNSVELGDGVFGVEAASQRYFHKSAMKITKSEAALMAAALPNPKRYSIAKPGPYMQKRQAQILRLMPKMAKVEFLSKKKSKKK